MKNFMLMVARVTGLLGTIALWIAGTGVVIMTAFIAMQVFFRYVLNSSLPWTEPAAVMIMGWFIFLGAAVGIREGYHLSFDVVLYFVPEKVKLALYTISDIVVGAFAVGMVKYGWELAERTAHNKLPSLGISGAFDFLPIVVGGCLLVLFCIERIARRAAGLPTSRFGDDHEDETPKSTKAEA
ncbi:TRAP-type C4-dicarboxylate transport system permease small subunit [Rhodobacter aestuarii]|uniref:TRAP transporter small permease protein n=1 Tax=Rhodobacter aestuarii TaxID=453582 RepID=A0A1N7PJZ1_9RHOB|nr:TRAP transporter small permease [Rhodobacter aestuarii]PTV94356.1 TRAP-type C4-dicarboxylate transport system permease small subunit [Rhodobacter aestuarii]SIT10973.1 TRAP-type C4-dicarboxylate transport system, small permease component [Rhodobacter aestuarii]